ncbi:hypothetical protein LY76DRAFT_113011 [Colletotrichum caudatum]|nr:hypothetical protein LY76DRAFT_113011 [Colletotrichum caudatum]
MSCVSSPFMEIDKPVWFLASGLSFFWLRRLQVSCGIRPSASTPFWEQPAALPCPALANGHGEEIDDCRRLTFAVEATHPRAYRMRDAHALYVFFVCRLRIALFERHFIVFEKTQLPSSSSSVVFSVVVVGVGVVVAVVASFVKPPLSTTLAQNVGRSTASRSRALCCRR